MSQVVRAICVSAFLLAALPSEAQQKPIRLRNELIHPEPAGKAAQAQAQEREAASGLFLVQFSSEFQPEWRAPLSAAGVELLRYVPENTFVAELRNAAPGQVRALPFVERVLPYRTDHKVHPSLFAPQRAANLDVRILLSPKAGPQDLARTRGLLRRFDRQSPSRFGIILDGAVNGAQLQALSESSSVLWIEPAAQMKLFDEISSKIVGGDDGSSGTFTTTQQLGFDGSGVVVAVADSGLDSGDADFMHPDLAGRVDAFFHYGTLEDAADEHSHGTHVAGIIAGNATVGEKDDNGFLYGLGVAPGARIIAQRMFDGIGRYHPPPSMETLTRDAVRAGAHIGSNSWGDDTQGRYDLFAAEFDALVRDADFGTAGDQPYILEFSAGNAGPGVQTIGTPALAKNVIATGASENDRFDLFIYDSGRDTMADFSSRGPCEDGRIKPDVIAPGTWIASLRSVFGSDDNAWLPISGNYIYQGGTSQSGPHVSGAAAVFVQWYRQTITDAVPSPALVKAALINSAIDIDDGFSTGPIPNNDEGWGMVDLTEIIDSPRRFEFLDQTVTLTHGQVFEHKVLVASSDQPLKITLTYTDVPGFPASVIALVNDLDLEVIAPSGQIFRGNQFHEGESVPDAPSPDNINNVEAVHLNAPLPGEYTVRIRARKIVEDARTDTPGIDQDFALVISADIPFPGAGVIFFDRRAYRAPDTIRVTVIDFDLIGQPSVNVSLRSATEPAGEIIELPAIGSSGAFSALVPTATGTASSDGQLQVAHGDTIEATYQDASPPATRTATARADLIPPVLTNVSSTNRFGKTIITWQTDEPASAIVRYGTDAGLTLAKTNSVLTTAREVILEDLETDTTYFFIAISADEAGNVTTNDNNGLLFSFVAQPAAPVLLVNSYTFDPEMESESEIPLASYTDALDQTGVAYEVWNVTEQGQPLFSDLQPFEVVIWRINDSFWNLFTDHNSISPPQQAAITSYLDNGGAFFMASMEILSRLGEVAFRTNVLQVQSFLEDVGVPQVSGVANDPVSSGINLTLDYSAYPDFDLIGIPRDLSDTIVPAPDSAAVFHDTIFGDIAGVRFPRVGQDSAFRAVFFPFPFDSIPETGPHPDNRANVLRNVLSFLAPGINGLGTIAFDNLEYTIPSIVTVEVADSDLAGDGQTTVQFFSDSAPQGQTITLNETVRPGLFRGVITLMPSTSPPAPGQLRTAHDEDIWAEYFDESGNSMLRVYAAIDTIPPQIHGTSVQPDYIDATVTWSTSEPTDALVQFGESPFLGRTAYSSQFNLAHELLLPGLLPDKTYFFQVVSRDVAGNAVVDDNAGNFHTFRTLKPITPPWFDNLESGATNWVVLDGEIGQSSWELGTPDNGRETAAFSPVNAWGSNLTGRSIDEAETFLVSPALELVGGNEATLRFRHNYAFPDFDFDIFEFADLYISTNGGMNWTLLREYFDESFGWETEAVDLTPYLGKVVRFGWYYLLFSFENEPRPGWLVDDISVTVSGDVNGPIQITNNLAQARFTLEGPFSLGGFGWNTVIENAPAGQYTVTFEPVPFYNTPPPQTNSLDTPSGLVFTGTYTFIDANNNGIADDWEQFWFGEVSPERTAETDTDGDGFTDYEEFMAGTNPLDGASLLLFDPPVLLPDGSVQFQWNSVVDRAYRLQSSADLLTWSPVSPWVHATSASTSLTLPAHTNAVPELFRIEVKP